MLRKSREFRWACPCCSIDPPTRVDSRRRERRGVDRRIMKALARRREERRWVREAREERR